MAVENLNNSEEGQALFELVVFIPFLIFLTTVMITVGNSINGSINQQKVTRRYFYHILKGSPNVTMKDDLDLYLAGGVNRVGMFSIGWRAKDGGGDRSFSACYGHSQIFSLTPDDTCDEPATEGGSTDFVRIYTYYGICGETYTVNNAGGFMVDYSSKALSGSCSIR